MTNALQRVLIALQHANEQKPRHSGNGWVASCPVHDDNRPSLSITEGEDGRVLLHCHAGCNTSHVVDTLGLSMSDLMPTDKTPRHGQLAGILSVSECQKPRKTHPTSAAAILDLEQRLGKSSVKWLYTDSKSKLLGIVVRWDKPGGKEIRPISQNQGGWVVGGMPPPRPLYRLPDLPGADRIYVVEGEKASDSLREIGLTATTSPHGSKSASKADWGPLADKHIVIMPDHDEAGSRYAEDVVALLSQLSQTPTVAMVYLPDLPKGGDACDYIDTQRLAGKNDQEIREAIEALASQSEPIRIEQPRLPIRHFRPFPTDCLPEALRHFVVKGAHAIGCDPCYLAVPTLVVLASCIGNSYRVTPKRPWTEPAILWAVIVGESGSLKSPAFRLVLKPIRLAQQKALQAYKEAEAKYQQDLARYKAEILHWRRKRQGDPPLEPEVPQVKRFVVADVTVEALAPILNANPRGVLLARDELAAWVKGFDRYAGGTGSDSASYLSMYDGDEVIVDRKTASRQTIYVPSAAVSVIGGIQPRILERAFGLDHRESGLLARHLFAMPPAKPALWTEAEIPENVEKQYHDIVQQLLESPPRTEDDGTPRPGLIPLDAEAKRMFIQWHDLHARESAELVGDLAASYSKLKGVTLRLALILHCVRVVSQNPAVVSSATIDASSITAAMTLVEWFKHEAHRVYETVDLSDEIRDRLRLVEVIKRKGGSVSVRDWQRTRSHRKAGDAKAELNSLVEADYGDWKVPEQTGSGRPIKHFVLKPDTTDTDKTPFDVRQTLDLSEPLAKAPVDKGNELGKLHLG